MKLTVAQGRHVALLFYIGSDNSLAPTIGKHPSTLTVISEQESSICGFAICVELNYGKICGSTQYKWRLASTVWSPYQLVIVTVPDLKILEMLHYSDVIMSAIAPQITSVTIVYSTVYSGVDERKHQSSASLAFVWGIHRRPVNSPHKGPSTRKMFPFDDVPWCLFGGIIKRISKDTYQ